MTADGLTLLTRCETVQAAQQLEERLVRAGIAAKRSADGLDVRVPEAVLLTARGAMAARVSLGARLVVLVPIAIIALVVWLLIWVFGKVGD